MVRKKSVPKRKPKAPAPVITHPYIPPGLQPEDDPRLVKQPAVPVAVPKTTASKAMTSGFSRSYTIPDPSNFAEARRMRSAREPGWSLTMLKALGIADPPNPAPPPGSPCVGCFAPRQAVAWMAEGILAETANPEVKFYPGAVGVVAPSHSTAQEEVLERAAYRSGGQNAKYTYYKSGTAAARGAERRARGLKERGVSKSRVVTSRRNWLMSWVGGKQPENSAEEALPWCLRMLRDNPEVKMCAVFVTVFYQRSDWLGWLAGKREEVGHQVFLMLVRDGNDVLTEIYDPNGEEWLVETVTSAVASELSALARDTWWRWLFGADLTFTTVPAPPMPGLQGLGGASGRAEPGGYCTVWSSAVLLMSIAFGERIPQMELRADMLAVLGLPDPGRERPSQVVSEGLLKAARTFSLNFARMAREAADEWTCYGMTCCTVDGPNAGGWFGSRKPKSVRYTVCGKAVRV